MTLKQPNRKRFISSIDSAIYMLQSEARCYGYGCEKEYTDLMNYLKTCRKQAMHTGLLYKLVLGDAYGLFQSGTAVLGDGTREPLVFQKTGDEKTMMDLCVRRKVLTTTIFHCVGTICIAKNIIILQFMYGTKEYIKLCLQITARKMFLSL